MSEVETEMKGDDMSRKSSIPNLTQKGEELISLLQTLNPSQQSVETLAVWILEHFPDYQDIVGIWSREYEKRKYISSLRSFFLSLIYLFFSWRLGVLNASAPATSISTPPALSLSLSLSLSCIQPLHKRKL